MNFLGWPKTYFDVWREKATLIGIVNAPTEPRRVIGVHLSKRIDDWAVNRALQLRVDNRKAGAKDKMQMDPNPAKNISDAEASDNDVLGARCETAVAYVIGLPFKKRAQYHEGDIGSIYQVRGRKKYDWDLLVYPDDNPDHVFILATSEKEAPRKVIVHGWLWGRECMKLDDFYRKKQDGKRKVRREGWFIPRRFLHSMFTTREDECVLSLPIDPTPPESEPHDKYLALPRTSLTEEDEEKWLTREQAKIEFLNEFLRLYPKKTSQEEARRAYASLIDTAGFDLAELVAGLRRWMGSDQWRRSLQEDGRFIPDPDRFLLDRLWVERPPHRPGTPAEIKDAVDKLKG